MFHLPFCAHIMSVLFLWRGRTWVSSTQPEVSAASRGSTNLRACPRVELQLPGRTPTPLSWLWTTGIAGCRPACYTQLPQGEGLCGPQHTAWRTLRPVRHLGDWWHCGDGPGYVDMGRVHSVASWSSLFLNFQCLMSCRKQCVFWQIECLLDRNLKKPCTH